MTCSIPDRRKLHAAIVAYMNGTIRTYAFDDQNCECSQSADDSVRRISSFLYRIHDDTVDHPISVTHSTWDTLTRVVAFLSTDLETRERVDDSFWPYADSEQLTNHQHTMADAQIPPYDPGIHTRQIHPWFNRIPTIVGVIIILAVLGLLMALISVLR